MSQRRLLAMLVTCMLGCVFVSWLRYFQLGTLRVDDLNLPWLRVHGPRVVFGLFMGVFAGTFLLLHQRARAISPLFRWAVALHSIAALSLPLTSNDVFSNLAYGHLSALGFNPYIATPRVLHSGDTFVAFIASRWRDTPVVYGPIVTAFCGAVGWVQNLWGALFVWKTAIFVITLAATAVAYRICRDNFAPAEAAKRFVAFALAPVAIWELSGQAHNDAILILMMTLFVWAALKGYEWLAVTFIALAVYAKFVAVAILGLYLVYVFRRNRRRALFMVMLVAVLGVALMLPYWQGPATLSGPLLTLGGQASRTSRSLADLAAWGALPFGPKAQKITYEILWLGGIAGLSFLGVRAIRTLRSLRDVSRQGLMIFGAYCIVATPWFQPWYVTWLLPLALVEPDLRLRQLVALYAALTPVQYILPLDPLTTLLINVIILRKYLELRPTQPSLDDTLPQPYALRGPG